MALSPAHRFGQIIGEVLETAVASLLAAFATKHGLYLDQKGSRPCRRGKKCSWLDLNGNTHDLDFVLERGGSLDKIGQPVAFIETAWRRYTKHSRNKAQEIQGAILPLAETHRHLGPFKGAILAGVFTSGALTQLTSLGFTLVYLSYPTIVAVFRKFKIDAHFDEHTPDADFQQKVSAYSRLTAAQRRKLVAALLKAHRADIDNFLKSLEVTILRRIDKIRILALHGELHQVVTIDAAIRFIEQYADRGVSKPIERYEIEVQYSNGDVIRGVFKEKSTAVDFLRTYQPPPRSVP